MPKSTQMNSILLSASGIWTYPSSKWQRVAPRPAETILRRYGIGTLRYANRPVKGNVRGRFIIPCRVSREPTFASVHGISFSPRFSPITFSSLFFMPRSAVWKSVVSSKGSYGAHAAARSGRGAVCRKIFLFPCGRAYFPTKSCSSYPRHLLMLPKQIPSIPAPLRHKKKVKGYEKRREK